MTVPTKPDPTDTTVDLVTDQPTPKEEEISDEVVRRVLKAKFGSDDPESFTSRLREADEMKEILPKYQKAVTDLVGRLSEMTSTPPRPSVPPKVAPDMDDEDEKFAELARIDPAKAIKLAVQKERVNMARMAALAEERGAARAQATSTQDKNVAYLQAEWPEAFDEKHELFHAAAGIFRNEMTEEQRKAPDGFLSASERAAARIGLAPRSKRVAPVKKESKPREDLESQNVGRGSPRPKDEAETAELSPSERHRLSIMGIDEKVYRQARAARKAGKNLRVEEGDVK